MKLKGYFINITSKDQRIDITDLNGRLITRNEIDNKQPQEFVEINIKYFMSGVYFVRVTSNDKSRIGKIIKY